MGFSSDPATSIRAGMGLDPPDLPGPGSGLIERTRLLGQLRDAADHQLTVLCAPAGFGKSVLVGQLLNGSSRSWSARRKGRPAGAAPTGSLRPTLRGPHASARPRPADGPAGRDQPGQVVLGFGAGGRSPSRFALIEDITADSAGDESMTRIERLCLDHPVGPLVIACRPDTPLSRWALARPGIRVMTEHDLAFTPDEVAALIHDATGRVPLDRQVAELMARTEGWPLAIRVAAMEMAGHGDWDGIVAGLDGTHHRIDAFLRHEVLCAQSETIQRLLVESSVVEEVDGAAAHILGAAPEQMGGLEVMARQRFFVRRSGSGTGITYRYFPMFREALRRELRERDPGAERPLLVAAAEWYDSHDQPDRAARYLIEGERWDALLDLVDRHGLRLYRQGRLGEVAGWLESVPTFASVQKRQVRLRQALAWSLVGGAGCADHVSNAFNADAATHGERVLVDVLRCRVASFERPAETVAKAGRAIDVLLFHPDALPNPLGLADQAHLLAMASLARARSLWMLGDSAASRSTLSSLAGNAEVPAALRVEAEGALALLEAWSRDHRAARERAGRVLVAWQKQGYPGWSAAADASLALAHLYREEGDPDAAVRWLQGMAEFGAGAGTAAVAALAALEWALLDLSAGRAEEGLDKLHRYELAAGAPPPPLIAVALQAAKIRLHLLTDDLTKAEGVLRTSPGPAAPGLAGAAIQVAMARSDLELATRRLCGWMDGGSGEDDELERDMWEAAIAFDAGHRRQALKSAARVVQAAEERHVFRMFIDAGPAVHRLLRSLARVAPDPYVCALAGAVGPGATAETGPLGLSAREREIIMYLPTSLSSAQMASRLYISVNTLKTHLRTIYRKLGVTGRREAIARAEQLGLA